MSRLLTFNKTYFTLAVVLFFTEILIARYLHDRIIRPYVGDLLVVILIYAFVKAFLAMPVLKTAIGVLGFAFLIEALQYFRIVHRLGLQDSRIARIVIGTSFEWMDLFVYTCGIGLVLCVERIAAKRKAAAAVLKKRAVPDAEGGTIIAL